MALFNAPGGGAGFGQPPLRRFGPPGTGPTSPFQPPTPQPPGGGFGEPKPPGPLPPRIGNGNRRVMPVGPEPVRPGPGFGGQPGFTPAPTPATTTAPAPAATPATPTTGASPAPIPYNYTGPSMTMLTDQQARADAAVPRVATPMMRPIVDSFMGGPRRQQALSLV